MRVVCNDCHGSGVEPGTKNTDCDACSGTGFFNINQTNGAGKSVWRFMGGLKHRMANRRQRVRHPDRPSMRRSD